MQRPNHVMKPCKLTFIRELVWNLKAKAAEELNGNRARNQQQSREGDRPGMGNRNQKG